MCERLTMITTLVLPQHIADEFRVVARSPMETAGVLFVSIVETPEQNLKLLARKISWVPEEAYIRRGSDEMVISSEGYALLLGEAEQLNATALWVHTHPGLMGIPMPSAQDEEVDRQIEDLFRLRTGSKFYGTLIISPRINDLTFTGFVRGERGSQFSIDRIWEVGDRFRLHQAYAREVHEILPMFDRSVRAFGGPIQAALGELRVGIVGAGGTGSSVAEQLVRLGVRHLTLIDPDHLTASNVTRVYGSWASDVGRSKVDILKEHLMGIAPDLFCRSVASMITQESTARKMMECDILFGCTDDNAGRLVLSRFSTFLLTPVIDSGVLLTNDAAGNLSGIDGRVTTLVPEQGCLVCRGRIDLARAAAEQLTPSERVRREDEGYAPALGAIEPAVVSFTTLVAAQAVSELLERFIGYGPTPRPSEVLLRCHDREMSTNTQSPRTSHYCHPSKGKIGRGITEPFLEQTWPN